MATITTTNFNQVLGNTLRSLSGRQAAIQSLLLFGLEYAIGNNGNFLYVSKCVRDCEKVKGLNTGRMVKWVQHVAAVTYTTDKVGDMVFKPLPESKRDGRPLVDTLKALASNWFDDLAKAKQDPAIKTPEQLISYMEKWVKADSDRISPDARNVAQAMLAIGKQVHQRMMLNDLAATMGFDLVKPEPTPDAEPTTAVEVDEKQVANG